MQFIVAMLLDEDVDGDAVIDSRCIVVLLLPLLFNWFCCVLNWAILAISAAAYVCFALLWRESIIKSTRFIENNATTTTTTTYLRNFSSPLDFRSNQLAACLRACELFCWKTISWDMAIVNCHRWLGNSLQQQQ